MTYTKYDSPIGVLTLTEENNVLTGLYYEGQFSEEETNLEQVDIKNQSIFKQVNQWLDGYFKGENRKINFDYKAQGTEFREQVWYELIQIPYGVTVTYRDIAKKVAKKRGKEKMSAQAVGGAVGSNPISIIIPCHRVVGADQSLTGYGGGIDRKAYLLERENLDLSQFKY